LSKLTFEHKTSVFLPNIDREVNQEALIISIGLERAEYEPEQFPGLVFRPGVVDATLLVFFTGKIIVDGTSDSEEALRGVRQVEVALVSEVLI
jgi:transcription initiation factor TFIID TATA-box-binding protein